jgi:hypothetical protein
MQHEEAAANGTSVASQRPPPLLATEVPMSVTARAMARHPSGSGPGALRTVSLLFLSISLLASLAITATWAGPPQAITRLSPEAAREAGRAVGLLARDDLATGLVQVREMATASTLAAGELLAVAPGASRAAFVARRGLDATTLTVADADGGQLLLQIEGAVGAAFSADAATLAVVNGSGALLEVDLVSGEVESLADGPFLGPLEVGEDGSMLLLAVPSVEAPFESRLVRYDPSGGGITVLADEPLVYGARRLADGSLAVVTHQLGGGTVVHRLAQGTMTRLADLGSGAVNVSVAPNGRAMAWERAGEGVYFAEHPQAAPRLLGPGSNPQIGPDGRSILVITEDGGQELITADGGRSVIAGAAAFATCAGGCRP